MAVSGTELGGKKEIIDLVIKNHEFKKVDTEALGSHEETLDYVTRNFKDDHVMELNSLELLNTLEKRPFFVHFSVDSSASLKVKRWEQVHQENIDTIDDLFLKLDKVDFQADAIQLREKANIKLKIMGADLELSNKRLEKALEQLLESLQIKKNPFENVPPLRPDWDTYFMKLATLAASRSNCMKRKVGCVIVRDHRVIATGYNGTPRHLTNCFNGGCRRCNNGDSKNLSTCLCLHAEENALLEAGRDRVGVKATLYCDTCPCLTCSVKIVQTGIKEVVYSQTYRMDEESFKVLTSAGINVRQFNFTPEPRIVIV